MENKMQLFSFEGAQIRSVVIDGEPWFVAKDVCNVLGVQQPARAVENLDSDEVSKTHITDSLNRQQETYIVNESGLYALVIRSNKPRIEKERCVSRGKERENEMSEVWVRAYFSGTSNRW